MLSTVKGFPSCYFSLKTIVFWFWKYSLLDYVYFNECHNWTMAACAGETMHFFTFLFFFLTNVIQNLREFSVIHVLIIPPANKVAGVYSDSYVHPFVRLSIRPSQSLICYYSKTAEQNFMKLSGIVHFMMPYCTSYFSFLSAWFWGFPEQNKDFAITTYGWGGTLL